MMSIAKSDLLVFSAVICIGCRQRLNSWGFDLEIDLYIYKEENRKKHKTKNPLLSLQIVGHFDLMKFSC